MAEELLRPRSSYEVAVNDRKLIADREVKLLVSELAQFKDVLDDHGYRVEVADNLVSIKRGPLDVVRVVFNAGDTGLHRVTNGIAEALRQGFAVDLNDPAVARHEFKVQLRQATDLFYNNKPRFEALGLV